MDIETVETTSTETTDVRFTENGTTEVHTVTSEVPVINPTDELIARIASLEEEVASLKDQLAAGGGADEAGLGTTPEPTATETVVEVTPEVKSTSEAESAPKKRRGGWLF